MDYINLLNECPIVWCQPEQCFELYSPYGEVLAYPTRKAAENARREILNDYQTPGPWFDTDSLHLIGWEQIVTTLETTP